MLQIKANINHNIGMVTDMNGDDHCLATANFMTPDMKSRRNKRVIASASIAALDLICILLGFGSVHVYHLGSVQFSHGFIIFATLSPIYILISLTRGNFNPANIDSKIQGVYSSIRAIFESYMAMVFFWYLFKSSASYSRFILIYGMIATFILISISRYLAYRFVFDFLGGAATTTLVICDGVSYEGGEGEVVLNSKSIRFSPNTDDPYDFHELAYLSKYADRILVACNRKSRKSWSDALRSLSAQGELILFDNDTLDASGIGHFYGRKTIVVSDRSITMMGRLSKRMLDITISIASLLILSPVIFIVAIAIKAESRAPILFVQKRIGRNNEIFNMYKFRSMFHNMCDDDAVKLTSRDDNRVTRVGKFIRKTSIDELPQIFNVIIGDMSIVGPRPHALSAKAGGLLYWNVDEKYRHRHKMKPGITGLAQIRGYRGNTEKKRDLINRLNSDLEYVNSWTILLDISIILKTAGVFMHDNAF